MATKRKDKSRVVLKTGEVQRKDGTYQFSWQDSQMKRRFVYARTLDDLREKEKRIQKDKYQEFKKNGNTKFVRYSEGAEMYHMSVSKFMQMAKDGKAIYKLGQLVLVNLKIFDEYIETFHIVDDEFYK